MMKVVLPIAFLAALAIILALLGYVAPAIVHTAKWYIQRRNIVNSYGIRKGLSIDETQARVPGDWEELGSDWTDEGEVIGFHCEPENGPALLCYFLRGRLFSWHTSDEPIDPNDLD